MSVFNGFLGQLADGVLSPKGNLGDYAHASRLFVTENQKLAPHQKFLYHCYFQMDPVAASILPDLKAKRKAKAQGKQVAKQPKKIAKKTRKYRKVK